MQNYIYLLKNKGVVVYVGQSISFSGVINRLKSHANNKEFNSVEFQEAYGCLDSAEAKAIFKYTPKYNLNMPTTKTHTSKAKLMDMLSSKILEGLSFKYVGDTAYIPNEDSEEFLLLVDEAITKMNRAVSI